MAVALVVVVVLLFARQARTARQASRELWSKAMASGLYLALVSCLFVRLLVYLYQLVVVVAAAVTE